MNKPVWHLTILHCPHNPLGLDTVEFDCSAYSEHSFDAPLEELTRLLKVDLCKDDRIRICLGWPNMKIFYGYPGPAVRWVLEQAETCFQQP